MQASRKRLRAARANKDEGDVCGFDRAQARNERKMQAALLFENDLLDKWCFGDLTYASVCTLAWYHTESGGLGAERIAYDPSKGGANQARHLRDVLGLHKLKDRLYWVKLPVWDKLTAKRIIVDWPIKLANETIQRDLEVHPAKYDLAKLPPDVYETHVRATGQCSIHTDILFSRI